MVDADGLVTVGGSGIHLHDELEKGVDDGTDGSELVPAKPSSGRSLKCRWIRSTLRWQHSAHRHAVANDCVRVSSSMLSGERTPLARAVSDVLVDGMLVVRSGGVVDDVNDVIRAFVSLNFLPSIVSIVGSSSICFVCNRAFLNGLPVGSERSKSKPSELAGEHVRVEGDGREGGTAMAREEDKRGVVVAGDGWRFDIVGFT